jgi:hypothetical protein
MEGPVTKVDIPKESPLVGMATKAEEVAVKPGEAIRPADLSGAGIKQRSDALSGSVKSTHSPQGSVKVMHSPQASGDGFGETVMPTRITVNSSVTAASAAAASPSTPPGKAAASPVSPPGASPVGGRKDGLRPTDSQGSPAFSPKEDYRLKRQSRSKTLPEQPVAKEEQSFATKVWMVLVVRVLFLV